MTTAKDSSKNISRRTFVGNAVLAAAASAIVPARSFLGRQGWLEVAQEAGPDLLHDTFNGLLAFVVPGPDRYSVSQGVSTPELGGVDAGVADALIAALDESTPFLPQFSATAGTVLNGLAQVVTPVVSGTFLSAFARLSFPEKVAVFQIMDATDSLKVLAGVLPALAAAFSYSEAGVFDPATRSLTGEPIGWQISNYQGVAEGRDEFLGYFGKR
jgi:hypothetical protein